MSNRVTLQRGNMIKNADFMAATTLLNEYEQVRELATLQLHQTSALLLQITNMKAAAVCWVSSHGVRLMTTCGLSDNLLARSLPKDLSFFAPEQIISSQDTQILQTIEAYLGIDGYQTVISVPLVAYSKQIMGAILLLDQQPREFEAQQLAHLSDLTSLVMQGINATREVKIMPSTNPMPLLEQAVLQSQESVITFDLNGTIQTWNVGASQIYGYLSLAIVGQHFKCLLPTEEMASFQAVLRQLQFEQTVVPYETTRIHQSGFRVQVRSSLHLVKNEVGKPVGFIEYSGVPTNPNQVQKDITTLPNQSAQSATFAEMVLQTIEHGVIVTNPEGYIAYVNPALLFMLGYESKDVLGKQSAEFVPPEEVSQIFKDRSERIDGWRTVSRYKVIRADGSLAAIEAVAYPRRHAQSREFQGTIALLRDMTLETEFTDGMTKLQAKLEREREFALQVTSSINQGLLVLDADGLVVYANPAVIQIAGLTDDHSLLGKKPWGFVPSHEQNAIRAEWKQLFKGQKRVYRHGVLRPDQAECLVEVTVYPKLDQRKRFMSAVMIITDITETLALETAALKARRAMERESRNALMIANTTSDGLAFINKDFVVEYVNPVWVELLGFDSSQSMIGKSSKTWVYEEDVPLLEKYDRILEAGQPCEYSYRVKNVKGELLTINTKSFPRIENGVYLGFISVARNWVATKKQTKLVSESLLILPHIKAALAFMRGVGGEHFFTASLEPTSDSPKLILSGRGFKLVVLEGAIGQLPSAIQVR
jgi:PAS domain S-box-containing protein